MPASDVLSTFHGSTKSSDFAFKSMAATFSCTVFVSSAIWADVILFLCYKLEILLRTLSKARRKYHPLFASYSKNIVFIAVNTTFLIGNVWRTHRNSAYAVKLNVILYLHRIVVPHWLFNTSTTSVGRNVVLMRQNAVCSLFTPRVCVCMLYARLP